MCDVCVMCGSGSVPGAGLALGPVNPRAPSNPAEPLSPGSPLAPCGMTRRENSQDQARLEAWGMTGTSQLGQSSAVPLPPATPSGPIPPSPCCSRVQLGLWPMEWLISPRFLPRPLTTGPLNLPGRPLRPNKPPSSSQRAFHRATTTELPS